MSKKVDGIRMKNGMDEVLTTSGFITDDEKFVVAANGRFVTNPTWLPTKKGNGTEFSIKMRLDISVSLMNNGVQGEFLIPYASGRVLHIRGSFGSRLTVATPFENESRNQYKNLLVSTGIFDAMKDAIKYAIDTAVEHGEDNSMVTASNSEYIGDADAFLAKSESLVTKPTELNADEDKQKELVDRLFGGAKK